MTRYEDLPLLPAVVAQVVAEREYLGDEVSGGQSQSFVRRVERDRQAMKSADIRAFAEYVDSRCRAAYEERADWFLKIVRSKSNRGRDQLYVWVTHWLASWLGKKGGYCA